MSDISPAQNYENLVSKYQVKGQSDASTKFDGSTNHGRKYFSFFEMKRFRDYHPGLVSQPAARECSPSK